jgi:hypothetical protein
MHYEEVWGSGSKDPCNDDDDNSVLIYLCENLTAQRPISM